MKFFLEKVCPTSSCCPTQNGGTFANCAPWVPLLMTCTKVMLGCKVVTRKFKMHKIYGAPHFKFADLQVFLFGKTQFKKSSIQWPRIIVSSGNSEDTRWAPWTTHCNLDHMSEELVQQSCPVSWSPDRKKK